MKKTFLPILFSAFSLVGYAQGTLSGDIMMNANFFQRDSALGTPKNQLYDNYLSGGEGWLTVRYNYKGFTAFARVDAFHNSNLYQPSTAITGFGLGAWSLSKEFQGLRVTGGYIYDQIGSGLLFRAYEDRGLLIDNALVGLHLNYKVNDNLNLKAFTGQEKDLVNFSRYQPVIKGFNAEGDFSLGKSVHIVPGIGVLNRTLDETSFNAIVSKINSQPLETRFDPKYNMYAFTAYNMLTAGNFSWYAEGAYKSSEAIADLSGEHLFDSDGNAEYTTIGYARKGIAINLTGKRTDNFVMRTSPLRVSANDLTARGQLNWQPVVARLRPQRLMARYTPASQDLSEMAMCGEVLVAPNDDLDVLASYTHINTLQDLELYREGYVEVNYRGMEKWKFQVGAQYMEYNQEVYQQKPGVPTVKALTPFFEVTYRFNNKTSIRTEWEYMNTQQDYGSWLFGLVELNIAPRWSFALSDMYIVDLNKNNPVGITDPQHYYNIFVAFNKGPHRFTLAYVKQVDGINCTGGVCRYEPAFSGVKVGLTSSF